MAETTGRPRARPSNDAAISVEAEQVRTLGVADYLSAAHCMAEAFEADALSRYFVDTPDRAHWAPAQKWALHLAIMQYITYAHCMKGIVTAVGPNNASVALWMPPGANMDDLRTILRSGLWRLHYKLSACGRARFFNEFFPILHAAKASVLGARDAHAYYLVYLGTRPGGRGRGYAGRLVGEMLARADAEGRPCYLESTDVRNLPLYRRCGFEVMRRCEVGPVQLDLMVREPRPLAGIKITARADSGVEMADGSEKVAVGGSAAAAAAAVASPKAAGKIFKEWTASILRTGGNGAKVDSASCA